MKKGKLAHFFWENFPKQSYKKSKTGIHRCINAILDIPAVESIEQFQPLLTAIDQVMSSITNDLNDRTLTWEERNAGGKKNYLINKILEKGQNSPLLLEKFPETIIQEIKAININVIRFNLRHTLPLNQQQFQPLLTAIDQVMPSITNDLNDRTLTRAESEAGGKKNYLINKIIEKCRTSPILLENFPVIEQEIRAMNTKVISSILDIPAVESQQQFQPLVTAIAQVMPSITNRTFTIQEGRAVDTKSYLIKKILEKGKYSPLILEKFFPVITQEIGALNNDLNDRTLTGRMECWW